MSEKAVLFIHDSVSLGLLNHDSVQFGFLGGTFFLFKQSQHLKVKKSVKVWHILVTYFAQQSKPIMMSRNMRKKKVNPERA